MKRLLLYNGKILTMNPSCPVVNSVLVERGKIIALDFPIDFARDADVIDLCGRTMLPAFRDAHVHFFQTGIRMVEFDAGKASSERELLEFLDKWVREKGDVNGYGYSPPDDRLPQKQQLDKISKKIPIFLRRIDGHSSAVNSAAFNLVKDFLTDKNDYDFERGWLLGPAHMAVDRYFLRKIKKQKLTEAAHSVAEYALTKGCSSLGALVPDTKWMKLFLDLKLDIRTVPFLETMNPSEAIELGLERVGGCMPMVDGSFGSHTAFLLEEYSDDPGNFGKAEILQEELDVWFLESAKESLQTVVHAIGDGAVDMVLKSINNLPNGIIPVRPRIEHAELLTDEQIGEITRKGIYISVQPVFEELWGGDSGLYAKRLGERWRRTNRLRTLLDAGIVLAGGSDSYITPIDPLRGISACLYHPNCDQRISLNEALEMFTKNVAISEGLFGEAGSLEIGKNADFVIICGDIENNNPETIEIEMTIIGGEIKYEKSSKDKN